MRINPPAGSWMTIDEELSQKVHQTTMATKSMLMVFFNPKEFVRVNLLPQGRSLIAVHFVDNVIIPLASRYAQQRGDTSRRRLYLHFNNSKKMYVQGDGQPSARPCLPLLCSPDLTIVDFYLFERLKQQLSGEP
jgi:hypothetical protein